ncbi:N-6 DNA methylase [Xanthomarina sp. F1114]|uniref:N-6 DNA methylase n=1 Tax=Xanthomarina sp. F1114 TaxID=2996019 RepID=UPI00225E4BD1|nr:N-6 DNA methylase [Xanthomarina sp. F1114]MCX7546833.1 N-6 DNA methylase [Xanthomarina sp. F1114]
MANERITEDIVRSHFKTDPLFNVVKLEEQRSRSRRINEILKFASKSGKGNPGFPEFIISFPSQNINYIVVIECKFHVYEHESPKRDKPKQFAVDGALHYSNFLSKDFDVISLAISGENTNELKVSTFRQRRGDEEAEDLDKTSLLAINDYLKLFDDDSFAESLKNIDILQKAVHLNDEFHSYSITENSRCTIVSGILLALLDEPFKQSYPTYKKTPELAEGMLDAIVRVLNSFDVRNKQSIIKEFNKILNEPIFKQKVIKRKKEEKETIQIVKEDFIDYLFKNVHPLIKLEDAGVDVLGKFYTEFIRYAGSSQKQGLVLTPTHVTSLFCDLANISDDTVIYDPCCGSGSFLISAMKEMLKLADGDSAKKKTIKSSQLVGVERRPDMFSYACTNMMFRGDGKSNIYNGDCFNHEEVIKANHSPDVVFLNPPYDVGNAGQMEFIEHGLKVVADKKGIVIGIVQVSCAIKNEKNLIAIKKRLLQNHTLKAVISMPNELFYPVAANTCIMVWQANIPNDDNETWFGYLKDDGFEKRKNRGRLDFRKRWDLIKSEFVRIYKNRKEIPGTSIQKLVSGKDEWIAEAYLKTDYTSLTQNLFENKIKDYISFKVKRNFTPVEIEPFDEVPFELDILKWKEFQYGGNDGIFKILNGYYNRKPEHTENGNVPFIGATENNNGVTQYYSLFDIENHNKDERSADHDIERKIFKKNCITITNNGSVGYAFYQDTDFTCSHDVNVILLKNKEWNPYIAMFICTIVELEQYRWDFGRKWRPSRMPFSTIKLPADKDGNPYWEYMEKYIKTLRYSKSL